MSRDSDSAQALRLVAAGLISLAVAMGIGRFAFTPLLPLMLRDGQLDPASGAQWAMANYIGYLIGALTSARVAADPRRATLVGLAGVSLFTFAVGCVPDNALAFVGLILRGAAGICSAWVLVGSSGWCLIALAKAGQAALAAWIYTGVGVGIAGAGLIAWLGGMQPAHWLWLELGAVAALGAALTVRMAGKTHHATEHPSGKPANPRPPPDHNTGRHSDPQLILCYGAFGYGYTVLATYLPAMAQQGVDDPLVFGLTWPIFGLAAAGSVAISAKWGSSVSRERVWALAQTAMAIGTALPLLSVALGALILSAMMVGGTFMVATMAGLQLARERHPDDPTALVARMTIAFASGQIAGPLVIWALTAMPTLAPDALQWANLIATVLLSGSAAWLWRAQADASPRS
ncbi:MAG: YbfB/YjiJ family MFS transporter [Betaproteobacteria bacterium]